jgi:hypothetical protein
LTCNNINSLAILFSYSHIWLPDNWHCLNSILHADHKSHRCNLGGGGGKWSQWPPLLQCLFYL